MGSVHAGLQLRWYEELCRIRVQRIRDVVASSARALASNRLPARGGVYCFWWTGDLKLLTSSQCNRHIKLGSVKLHWDDNWLGIAAKLPIPLYVGKNGSH